MIYLTYKYIIMFLFLIACKAIKVHYQGILTTAYSTLLIQIIWLLIWTTAMISIYKLNLITTNTNPDVSNNDDNNQDLPILLMFITFLSFYWGTEVVKALLQTTVSGTIACWWFQLQRESPVQGKNYDTLWYILYIFNTYILYM